MAKSQLIARYQNQAGNQQVSIPWYLSPKGERHSEGEECERTQRKSGLRKKLPARNGPSSAAKFSNTDECKQKNKNHLTAQYERKERHDLYKQRSIVGKLWNCWEYRYPAFPLRPNGQAFYKRHLAVRTLSVAFPILTTAGGAIHLYAPG
jgi:hypothetical protein